jgi:FixJ family two-component response regulator
MTTVYIIDDDASFRKAMKRLMVSAGLDARTFESALEFLDEEIASENACIITDVQMRGLTGLELQQRLKGKGVHLPIIFVTALDTKDARKQARASGAAGYFRKPVDDQALLDAIEWALSKRNTAVDTRI